MENVDTNRYETKPVHLRCVEIHENWLRLIFLHLRLILREPNHLTAVLSLYCSYAHL